MTYAQPIPTIRRWFTLTEGSVIYLAYYDTKVRAFYDVTGAPVSPHSLQPTALRGFDRWITNHMPRKRIPNAETLRQWRTASQIRGNRSALRAAINACDNGAHVVIDIRTARNLIDICLQAEHTEKGHKPSASETQDYLRNNPESRS